MASMPDLQILHEALKVKAPGFWLVVSKAPLLNLSIPEDVVVVGPSGLGNVHSCPWQIAVHEFCKQSA